MKTVKLLVLLILLGKLSFSQTSITASTTYLSGSSTGDYKIYSSSATSLSQVDKAIILIEGFDKYDIVPSDYIFYQIFNSDKSNRLGYQLMNQGYDIIILNFANNGDYIQRNAFLVKELIQLVNTNKQGSEDIIVYGLNTGAIIARYALAWMEQNNIAHHTKIFASIDSPNKGLNIPPGYQFVVKQISNGLGSLTNALQFKLDGPMFKQLVYNAVSPSGAWTGTHFDFDLFFNDLNTLNGNGYPKLCKNIAVSNGAKKPNIINGNAQGETALRYEFTTPNTIISGTSSGRNITSHGYAETFFNPNLVDPSVPKYIELLMGTSGVPLIEVLFKVPLIEIDGMDVAPGAYTNVFFKEFDNYLRSLPYSFSGEKHEITGSLPNTTFIPTISALGLNKDWFYDIFSNPNISCEIPYDAYYAPININNDITLNSTIASNWIFDQLTLSNNTIELTQSNNFNSLKIQRRTIKCKLKPMI